MTSRFFFLPPPPPHRFPYLLIQQKISLLDKTHFSPQLLLMSTHMKIQLTEDNFKLAASENAKGICGDCLLTEAPSLTMYSMLFSSGVCAYES
jgi:hypothetical protein